MDHCAYWMLLPTLSLSSPKTLRFTPIQWRSIQRPTKRNTNSFQSSIPPHGRERCRAVSGTSTASLSSFDSPVPVASNRLQTLPIKSDCEPQGPAMLLSCVGCRILWPLSGNPPALQTSGGCMTWCPPCLQIASPPSVLR